MSKLEFYLSKYSESHLNPTNVLIHKICVPAIMFSSLGLLKAIPVPEVWPLWLDWSAIFILGTLIFYASLRNVKVFFFMVIFYIPMVFVLEFLRPRFFLLCIIVNLLAWIVQLVGHKIEGKKPSFLNNIFFLLIGPVWVIKYFIGPNENR